MISHSELPDATGLPGTENFVIPDLTKESDLRTLLQAFTQRALGQADPKPDATHQKVHASLQMATRALALLASTTQVNDAIRAALGFIRSAATLGPENIRDEFSATVHDLVDTLFAHNGFIFQAHLQDSSKKPRVTVVNTLMLERHRGLVRTRTHVIDLDAATEYVTPESVAAAEAATRGSSQDRRKANLLSRKATKDVNYGGTKSKAATSATDGATEDGRLGVAENASGGRLRSGKVTASDDAARDGADIDTGQFGAMVKCPLCRDQVHSDEYTPHTQSCRGTSAGGAARTAVSDAVRPLPHAVLAPVDEPQGPPPGTQAQGGNDKADESATLSTGQGHDRQLSYDLACLALATHRAEARPPRQQASPELSAAEAARRRPQSPGLDTTECFVGDCRNNNLVKGLCDTHQKSKAKPCKEAYWRTRGQWGIRTASLKGGQPEAKRQKTRHRQTDTEGPSTRHNKRGSDVLGSSKRSSPRKQRRQTSGVSSTELAAEVGEKVAEKRRKSRRLAEGKESQGPLPPVFTPSVEATEEMVKVRQKQKRVRIRSQTGAATNSKTTKKQTKTKSRTGSSRGAAAALDVSYLERGDEASGSPTWESRAEEQLNRVIESTKAWKEEHIRQLATSLQRVLAQYEKG